VYICAGKAKLNGKKLKGAIAVSFFGQLPNINEDTKKFFFIYNSHNGNLSKSEGAY
jgi:hypothetical protein